MKTKSFGKVKDRFTFPRG